MSAARSKTRRFVVFTSFTCVVLGASAAAQGGIAWESDLAAAQARSRKEARPMMIAFFGKQRIDRETSEALHNNPLFIQRAREFVCVVADTTKHHRIKIADRDPGSWRWACGRYGAIECAAHQACWNRGRVLRFVKRDKSGAIVTPQHVFVGPDGKPISRWAVVTTASRLLTEMGIALRAVGRGDEETALHEKSFRRLLRQARSSKSAERLLAIQELARLPLLEARRWVFALARSRRDRKGRQRALESLPVQGSFDALELLQATLAARHPEIRNAAVRGIGDLKMPSSVTLLLDYAEKKKRPDDLVEVPRALALSAPDDERAVDWIAKTIRDARGPLGEAAMQSLLEIFKPQQALVDAVRGHLASKSQAQRERAAWVLRELEKRGKLDGKRKRRGITTTPAPVVWLDPRELFRR